MKPINRISLFIAILLAFTMILMGLFGGDTVVTFKHLFAILGGVLFFLALALFPIP
jgi:predicted Co/Zn/Cd cation transporter (cation efflux family)